MADAAGFHPLHAIGLLRPGAGTSQADLDEALVDLRTALDGGQASVSMLSAAHRDFSPARIDALARRTDARDSEAMPLARRAGPATAQPRTNVLVNLRTAQSPAADPLAPAWTRGLRPSATRGPFVNGLGERFWIDSYALPQLLTIVAEARLLGSPRVIALVPLGGPARRRLSTEGSPLAARGWPRGSSIRADLLPSSSAFASRAAACVSLDRQWPATRRSRSPVSGGWSSR
jgi:hypothetical protein